MIEGAGNIERVPGKCATYYKKVLQKVWGVPYVKWNAKDGGPHLKKLGFVPIPHGQELPGDHIIYGPRHRVYSGDGWGHIGILAPRKGQLQIWGNTAGREWTTGGAYLYGDYQAYRPPDPSQLNR